jgi:hypothetical protein
LTTPPYLATASGQTTAANVKDIASYVQCLNDNLPNGQPARMGDTVDPCLPKGCMLTVTMSPFSAQAACKLGACRRRPCRLLVRQFAPAPGNGPGRAAGSPRRFAAAVEAGDHLALRVDDFPPGVDPQYREPGHDDHT